MADEQQPTERERRLERLVLTLLGLIDAVAYRDATGLRLGDTVPVIERLRQEVMPDAH
jgi:hypothetical protein